ncbi:MAG: hypothetical protein HFG34_03520 [Eubacterium sp.]|nr:hypothetical protein [Eubacterium sp.]
MLYRDKSELLELYNAVNDTQYKNPEELETAGLENVVHMSVKNDVSCVVDLRMNLYEHQSTVNPNMPLRDLFYIAKLYEKGAAENRAPRKNCLRLFFRSANENFF